jgi:sodium-dependent dicarboxylate transporter 2/3/5
VSTAIAFGTTVALWVGPGLIKLALGPAHPLATWADSHVPEGVAALVGAVMLFILPGGPGRRALVWEEAARIDWGIILLYGGGMALGELSFSTGLAEAIGLGLTGWLPAGSDGGMALVAAATLVAVVTSEFTSNAASANMVVPVVIALARAADIPARIASVYAPRVTPEDFHVVAEIFLGDSWHLVDPTGMAHAGDAAIIGIGRDIGDVAFLTAFGPLVMNGQSVSVREA